MKEKVFSNLLWRFAERFGAHLVSFIVTIVLARILEPETFGRIALITAFTNILQVFVDGGLGNALIQKKDADELDFSSVFLFNIVFCTVIYILLFLSAPLIANYYKDEQMTSLIRVTGLIIIISGVKNVQQAYISRALQFKLFFFATTIGTVVSAFVGILLAYLGFGAWALVAQVLTNATIDTVVVWIMAKWKPSLGFSWARLKNLLSYGWKLLLSNLIDTLYGNIRQLLIGKVYSSSDLAFYNRGNQVPRIIVDNVNTSIDSVLFPVMSKEQDNIDRERNIARRAIKTSNYIMAPLMLGIACMAESLVKIFLTEKWMPCVPYLRLFCVFYVFQPLHTANTNAIKALGRSDTRLKQEILTKIVGSISILIALPYGPMYIAYSAFVANFVILFINNWPNRKLLRYTFEEQMKDIMPSTLLAAFMGGCVYGISFIRMPQIPKMILQVVIGIVVYIACSAILQLDSYKYLLDIVKRKRSV